MKKESNIVALDAMRGLATIVVALGHFFYGFAPRFHGLDYQDSTGGGLAGTPMFAIFNGTAAVIFFFVLSGFVLSLKPLRTQSYRSLGRSALKRWPRLAGPVLLICVVSASLAVLHLYYNHQAATLTGSSWLDQDTMGFIDSKPSLLGAIEEGSLLAFFCGKTTYNAVLWTMWFEFVGSFIVFSLAALFIPFKSFPCRVMLLLGAWGIAVFYQPYLSCFIVGMMFAVIVVNGNGKEMRLPNNWRMKLFAAVSLVFVVLIWGYHGPYGFYAPLGIWMPDTNLSLILAFTVAAILLMTLGLYSPPVRSALTNRVGVTLGRMSFSIYLTHLLVICSVSSWCYVILYGRIPTFLDVTAVLAATVIITAITAWALSKIDLKLTRWLDLQVTGFFANREDRTPGQSTAVIQSPFE